MAEDTELSTLVSTRIYETTSLNAAPQDKPFILYRQTSDIGNFRGDDGDLCRSEGYMIFVHDVPGDYMRIDSIITRLRHLFQDVRDGDVVRSHWLETSEDFRDEEMGTIMKYGRLQVIYRS